MNSLLIYQMHPIIVGNEENTIVSFLKLYVS